MHLLWIAFILHSGGRVRQLQVNAIQFPKSNPSISWLKFPTAFLFALSEVAPCWDNACLYNSRQSCRAICSCSSDIWQLTFKRGSFLPGCSCSLLSVSARLSKKKKKKGCIGWVLQAKTGASKHNEGLAGAPPCLVPLQKMRKILSFFW